MTENQNEIQHVEAVALEKSAIESMERASIDIQIATAHRYPRSISEFNRRAKEMVSVDLETAESCIYRRPVGKDNGGQITFATGESIRAAEIVAACYGNLRVQAIISEMTPTYVKAIGMAHDLESNYAQKAEVVESTVTRAGKPYDERMRIVVAKAAQSKAIRDAIFKVVPKSLCKSIINEARKIISGSERTLEERRASVSSWLSKLSIDPKRIFNTLSVGGIEEIGNEELELLTGLRTALKEGDITLDEAFPPIQTEVRQGVDALADKLKKNGREKADQEKEAELTKEAIREADESPAKKILKESHESEKPKILPEERYYCEICDETFAEPRGANKNLCPKLHKNIIDRLPDSD